MNKTCSLRNFFLLSILMVVSLLFSCSNRLKGETNFLKYVDQQIGGVAPILQPTRTRMYISNLMVRVYPKRKDYKDDKIASFPLNMLKHRFDSVFNILPVSGEVDRNVNPVSAWDQELEIGSPYYYSIWLEDFNIIVEYTPSERAGFYRFTYENPTDKKLFLRKINGVNRQQGKDGSLTGTCFFPV